MKNFYLLFIILIVCVACGGKRTEPVKDQSLSDQKSLAIASYYRSNYRQALEDIQKAEQINSKDPEVYYIEGLIYFNLKEFKKVETAYKKALALNKDYSEVRYNLCGLYLTMNKPEKAVHECKVASSDFLYKSRDRAFWLLGVAYYNLGKYDKAEEALKSSLDLNPSLVVTQNELGKLYLKLGRNKEAIDFFQRAIAGLETFDEAHYNLGLAYLEVGKTQEACQHFRKVAAMSPNKLIGINAKEYVKTICSGQRGGR